MNGMKREENMFGGQPTLQAWKLPSYIAPLLMAGKAQAPTQSDHFLLP